MVDKAPTVSNCREVASQRQQLEGVEADKVRYPEVSDELPADDRDRRLRRLDDPRLDCDHRRSFERANDEPADAEENTRGERWVDIELVGARLDRQRSDRDGDDNNCDAHDGPDSPVEDCCPIEVRTDAARCLSADKNDFDEETDADDPGDTPAKVRVNREVDTEPAERHAHERDRAGKLRRLEPRRLPVDDHRVKDGADGKGTEQDSVDRGHGEQDRITAPQLSDQRGDYLCHHPQRRPCARGRSGRLGVHTTVLPGHSCVRNPNMLVPV